MPSIIINGNALNVERDGAGDPVVLVHGGWTGAGVWHHVAAALREHHDVTAYDRLGYNGSDRPVTSYTRERHEADLVALIEHLDAGPVHLVGSSYGGSMALAVAARRPDLVRSAAVHEAPCIDLVDHDAVEAARLSILSAAQRVESGDAYEGTRQFFEEVALGAGGWDMLPEAFRSMALNNAPTFAAETHDPYALTFDIDALAAYPGRVLLTQGDSSPAWFGVIVEAIARRVAHAERALLRGVSHGPHSTHPVEYATLLAGWLRNDVPLAGSELLAA
jgi:pimeloyl-ACP methyl ester carboxylesterase